MLTVHPARSTGPGRHKATKPCEARASGHARGGPWDWRGVRVRARRRIGEARASSPPAKTNSVGSDKVGTAGSVTGAQSAHSSQHSWREGDPGSSGPCASPNWAWQIGPKMPASVADDASGAATRPRPTPVSVSTSVKTTTTLRRSADGGLSLIWTDDASRTRLSIGRGVAVTGAALGQRR
jgi:hypothetical protein